MSKITKIDVHKHLLNFDEICIDLSFVYQLKQMFSKIKATRMRYSKNVLGFLTGGHTKKPTDGLTKVVCSPRCHRHQLHKKSKQKEKCVFSQSYK